MLKLTKTGIGLLTRQYRSVLRKCWEINVGLWNWAMNTATGAASAVGGAMNALWGSSKNSAKEFSELIAALLKCNFLNDAIILKNIANIFAISAKIPAKPFASLYEGTLNTFNVIDGLKHNIPKGISKVALLATVAVAAMLPSGRAEADENAGYLCVGEGGNVYYSNNSCGGGVGKLRNSIDWFGDQLIEGSVTISDDLILPRGAIFSLGSGSVGDISNSLSASSRSEELITAKAVYDYVNSSINNAGYLTNDHIKVNVSSGVDPAVAYGSGDIAIGRSAVAGASGRSSSATAIGYGANATGLYSIALGFNSYATGDSSIALGDVAYAEGGDSIALGDAYAGGDFSIALGRYASADGNFSIALGEEAEATGLGSIALGRSSVADENNTVSVGSSSTKRKIVNVAAGSADTDAVNYGQIKNFVTASTNALTNYYTKNESDESSKRENLTTQNGDTLNKASNTVSAMAENVPATKLRYNNKPTITGTNSTEFSLRGILNRKRFKMFADLLQQATNDNALTITTNVTTIAA